MKGPEHYRSAEKLLESCQISAENDLEAAGYPAVEDGVNSIGNALAAAQVHATLAVAIALRDVLRALGPPPQLIQLSPERRTQPRKEDTPDV